MIRLLKQEIYKLWSNKTFLMYFTFLILINIFLMWSFNNTSQFSFPSSAYLKLTQDLKELSINEQNEFIKDRFSEIDGINKIDYMLKLYQYNKKEYASKVNGENKDVYQKYMQIYEDKTYLRYTNDISSEYLFLDNAKKEVEQVFGYEDFLANIQKKSKTLSQASIFNKEGGYSSNNIKITAKAFEDMHEISINYSPQKGLVTALNFYLSDISLIFIMILISFTLVREEKENGMINLIRSTPQGRLMTALAKMLALIFSLLIVVFILYGTNLVYCNFIYGLGDLTRTIQSVPYLMRSTLKINILEYLFLYMGTKWIAAVVTGIWILFSMFVAKNMILGILSSVSMPVISLIIRAVIPATHKLNVIKYANIISFLQTNEILGSYRNLHWFNNTPIQLNIVETVAGIIFFAVFAFVFLLSFSKIQIITAHKKSKNLFKKFKKDSIKATTIQKQEWYKLLVINGGAILLTGVTLFTGYSAFTSKNYIDADEMFYASYMKEITGKYDIDSYNFLMEKNEKFEPIYKAEKAMMSRTISYEEYNMFINANYALNKEFEAYQRVVGRLSYIKEKPSAHLLYDTGYAILFGFNNENKELSESIFSVVSIILLLSGFMTMEKTSGMKKIIFVTPLGRIDTLKAKYKIAFVISCVVAMLSLIPRLCQVGMGYGFKGLFSPLMSMTQYSKVSPLVLVVSMILFMIFIRILACFAVSMIVLFISQISTSYIFSVMVSSVIVLFPLVLYYMKMETIKYFSVYSVFNISQVVIHPYGVITSIFYMLILVYIIYMCKEMLKLEYDKI